MLPVKAADFAALEVFSLLYEETTFFAFHQIINRLSEFDIAIHA